MTRYIDADALKRKAQKVATEAWKMRIKSSVETVLNQFIDWIEDMPTIDAVKVVRCKNCKLQRGCKNAQYLGPDGFCSYGERKSNVSKEEIEYLNKAFPEHDRGEWFDITEIMTKGETE